MEKPTLSFKIYKSFPKQTEPDDVYQIRYGKLQFDTTSVFDKSSYDIKYKKLSYDVSSSKHFDMWVIEFINLSDFIRIYLQYSMSSYIPKVIYDIPWKYSWIIDINEKEKMYGGIYLMSKNFKIRQSEKIKNEK